MIDAFSSVVREQQLEAVIGVGGGGVCDVAKAVANETSAFLMTIPTSAATNAAFRKNSILYEENGAYAGGNQNASTADVLLIDTAIIGAAPRRYLIAGMIDSVSRSVDTRLYTIDSDNFVLAFIHQNAQLATDYLLKISERYAEDELSKAELAQAVDAIITVVGVAGAKSKGRMYRGVTHPLHNELTKLVHHPDILHGEIITFTTLVQLLLEGPQEDTLKGQVAGYVQDKAVLAATIKKDVLELRILPENIATGEVAFPFAKDEAGEKLRKEFDEELQKLLADGTIKALSEKYYGVDVTEATACPQCGKVSFYLPEEQLTKLVD